MDLVAFVLNTVIGVVLVGGTIGLLMQQEPPSAAALNGMPKDLEPSASATASDSPGPCPAGQSCAGPTYAPPPR